jgi:tripartite-type tricarboxylate transporter receptor subunit TctC
MSRAMLCGLTLWAPSASANNAGAADISYPKKPIRLIVPFVPGSGTDVLAREIARPLALAWGQPVVVDNRPGAGGMSGTALVAAAAADGHTLLLANVAALAIAPAMQLKPVYAPLRDFSAVTQLAGTANAIVVHPSVKLHSVRDLLSLSASDREALRYASGGTGTAGHLTGELLRTLTKINILHVPYKGSPAAMNSLLAAQTDMGFTSLVSTVPHIASGRLRAIAVTSLKRSKILPDIPTLDESGVTGFEVSGWQAILAPAGTHAAAIRKLQRQIAEIVLAPDVSARMATLGLDMIGSTPGEFARYLESEVSKWGTLVTSLGLKGSGTEN